MDKSNTYFLRLIGKVNIPEPLNVDTNYSIACNCSITQERRDSNQDGSYNITFKAEPLTAEILKSNGEIIKAKDPRRVSEMFRKLCWKEWHNGRGAIYDFQDVYEKVGYIAMSRMPELVEEAIKQIEEEK